MQSLIRVLDLVGASLMLTAAIAVPIALHVYGFIG